MHSSKLYALAAALMSLTGCRPEAAGTYEEKAKQEPGQTTDTITQKKPKENLAISSFKGLPPEVSGCACYFSTTEENFKNEEYVFAADYDSIGFISVNNKLTKLKLLTTERKPNTFGAHDRVDVYSTEHYKVTVDIKYVKAEAEEVWWNKGTLTIETESGEKNSQSFVGECGC